MVRVERRGGRDTERKNSRTEPLYDEPLESKTYLKRFGIEETDQCRPCELATAVTLSVEVRLFRVLAQTHSDSEFLRFKSKRRLFCAHFCV